MNESKPLPPGGQPEQVEELEREIQRLQAENERLKKKVKDLEEELWASKRQAAPFSKGQRKANPKRPGRKVGQGVFRNRPAPAASIDGEIVEAAVPEEGCPHCGGELEVVAEEWATTTDLPVQPQPQVTRYRVPVCRCSQCGKSVRGSAPGLAARGSGGGHTLPATVRRHARSSRGQYRRHRMARRWSPRSSDGICQRGKHGISDPWAPPQRRGAGGDPCRLRRSHGNRSRQKLRCQGIRCRRATEVPEPSSAQPYGSVGDQEGPCASVRSGLERYAGVEHRALPQALRSGACRLPTPGPTDRRCSHLSPATPHLERR